MRSHGYIQDLYDASTAVALHVTDCHAAVCRTLSSSLLACALDQGAAVHVQLDRSHTLALPAPLVDTVRRPSGVSCAPSTCSCCTKPWSTTLCASYAGYVQSTTHAMTSGLTLAIQQPVC
uniref:Uncharacterized protein n=1 Tax=Chlamydomonas chlamydogama TaxID=225041 RepID=A0A7S2QSH2_9CHLO